jgi:preprotein translocase subunit SecY
MPIIFAMSLLSFPQLIISLFVDTNTNNFYQWYSKWLGTGSWLYIILVGLLITFFAYFWTQVTFNPEDVSKNIQQNGGFIQGIRPGKQTAEYLKRISRRITLFGAVFLSVIAIIPSLIFKEISAGNLVNAFSATGLLIVVSVAIEFDKSLEAQMLMKNYKGFLK